MMLPPPANQLRSGDDAELATVVKRLVDELGNNKRATRESARRRLMALGPRVLDLLPPPAAITNPASRVAIRRLRSALERNAATRSARASLVNLQGRHSLEKIVAQLSHQTDNRLVLADDLPTDLKHPFSVDIRNRTFWQAVEEISRTARVRLVSSGGTAILRPGRPTGHSSRIAVSGPFRISATATAPRPLANRKTWLIPIRLQWEAEPRLRPLFLVCRPSRCQATGRIEDDKVALTPRSPDATLEVPLAAESAVETSENGSAPPRLRLDFQSQGRRPPTSLSLTGTADVWLAADRQPFVFLTRTVQRPVLKRRAGVAVALTAAHVDTKSNKRHDVTMRIRVQYESGGPSFESHRLWMLYNQAHLLADSETGKIRRMSYDRFDTPRIGDGTAELVYHFRNVAGPIDRWRFVYEAPTQILKVAVPWMTRDLTVPLPRSAG